MIEKADYYIQSDPGRPRDKLRWSLNVRKSHSKLSKDTRTLLAMGRPRAQDTKQEWPWPFQGRASVSMWLELNEWRGNGKKEAGTTVMVGGLSRTQGSSHVHSSRMREACWSWIPKGRSLRSWSQSCYLFYYKWLWIETVYMYIIHNIVLQYILWYI